MIRVSLMLINSQRTLHFSALSLVVGVQASLCNHSPELRAVPESRLRGGTGGRPGWLQIHFPPVPGKGLIQKQVYLSHPTAPQGRASCLRVECQLAVGTVAGGQRKFHISPRFLPLCSGPAGPALHSGESGLQPALETQAPGKSRALKPPASQSLP